MFLNRDTFIDHIISTHIIEMLALFDANLGNLRSDIWSPHFKGSTYEREEEKDDIGELADYC